MVARGAACTIGRLAGKLKKKQVFALLRLCAKLVLARWVSLSQSFPQPAADRRKRQAVVVRGVVQGVGFRPFVYRLAHETQLAGFIAELFAGMREGREMEARFNALSHLSNTDLARRGLSRAGITRAILYGCAK